jgi:hypothetical protein
MTCDKCAGSAGPGNESNNTLIMNLKRELDNALKNIVIKESEIKVLKKCQKVTKFQEIDVFKS